MATTQPAEVGEKRKLESVVDNDQSVESTSATTAPKGGIDATQKGTDSGDSSTPSKKPKKVVVVKKIVRKIRKARQQVPKRSADEELQKEEVAGDYNIWYHKYNGQRFSFKDRTLRSTRCNILRDSGWTVGCREKEPFFCLYFARGCCDQGEDCTFLHRLPTADDERRIPISKDCFGRDKHATDKDDMGGVGSFNRESRTLYIGGLQNIPGADMHEIVTRHFREWGQLDYVRVFPDRCYAFVKYKLRLCAEFAKEAMSNQSLDDDELLNVRWATDDPNPLAQQRNLMEQRERFMEALKQEGVVTKDLSFNYPKDYTPVVGPEAGPPGIAAVSSSTAAPQPMTRRLQSQPQPSHSSQILQPPGSNNAQSLSQDDVQKMHEFYAQYYQYHYPHMQPQPQPQQQQQQQQQEQQQQQQQQQSRQPKSSRPREKKEHDYYDYIHAQFKKNRVDEQKQKLENRTIQQQRRALGATDGSVDVYPDTSHQFEQRK